MQNRYAATFFVLALGSGACQKPEKEAAQASATSSEAAGPASASKAAPAAEKAQDPAAPSGGKHPSEVHFSEVVQLTNGGENAEAYWSFDNTKLIYQAHEGEGCDQIYVRDARTPGAKPELVSTGKGTTTCAYFLPGDKEIIYASTHVASPECPPKADQSKGYVWSLYAGFDIFKANADGTNLRQLTTEPGYDAEGTVCPADGSIVFTSVRDGDLELYRMDADGKNVKRLTNTPGYDGGAFFSSDCKKIVWRASRPTGEALADYQKLLKEGLVRPTKLELFVANADGSGAKQVTELGVAAFGPYFYPGAERIIFSSNYGDPKGREFDLWAVNVDGSKLERITHTPGFDGFPMFSHDGQWFAFASNRASKPGTWDTNLFVTRWVQDAPENAPVSAPAAPKAP